MQKISKKNKEKKNNSGLQKDKKELEKLKEVNKNSEDKVTNIKKRETRNSNGRKTE